MVLTMPGRTQGLGLFTEPLLQSLELDRASYGFLNTWATLLGALFCLPCGWLLDRFGTRAVLLAVTTALGCTVLAMSWWLTAAWRRNFHSRTAELARRPSNDRFSHRSFCFPAVDAWAWAERVSVVSLALIGRAAGLRSGLAMGVFAVATSIGFIAAFRIVGRPAEWRPAWAGIGVAVLVLGFVGAMLIRSRYLAAECADSTPSAPAEPSFTLGQALVSPSFWTFSVAISFLGLVLAGTSLFGESIMLERGLDDSGLADYGLQRKVFVNVAIVGIPFGLAANLLTGLLAAHRGLWRLMAVTTALFGTALLAFPLVSTEPEVYAYAATIAAAGGGMTVCFYTFYRRAFGPGHLGSIQGIAQMLTVLFSAIGPTIFAGAKTLGGAYEPLFYVFAAIALVLAILTWVVGMPSRPPVAPEPNKDIGEMP